LYLGNSWSSGEGTNVYIGGKDKETAITSKNTKICIEDNWDGEINMGTNSGAIGTINIGSNNVSTNNGTTTNLKSRKTILYGNEFTVNNTTTWIAGQYNSLASTVQTTVRSPTFRVDTSCNSFYCDASYSQIAGKKLSIESKNVVIDQAVSELYADARFTYFYGLQMNIRTPSLNIDASCSNFIVKAINTDLTGTNATATTQGNTDNSTKLATTAFVNNCLTSTTKDVSFRNVTANSFNATSDYRIKSNITSLDETYTVDNLNPVTYLNKQTDKQDIGLIAHELQEKYPMLVNGTKDGDSYQNVNYIGLIPVLIKEIQNLKQTVTDLNQRIKTLEEKP
jgi:hypothetical protein